MWVDGLDSSGSGREPLVDSCKHGNEPLCSIRAGNSLASEEGSCSWLNSSGSE